MLTKSSVMVWLSRSAVDVDVSLLGDGHQIVLAFEIIQGHEAAVSRESIVVFCRTCFAIEAMHAQKECIHKYQ